MKLKLAPSEFAALEEIEAVDGRDGRCRACGSAERVGLRFDYAYQPIVDITRRTVYAHEALVRGPAGEGAMSVLSQVNDQNRYRFD